MIKVLGIEHIGVALNDNRKLAKIFKEIFNLEHVGSEVVADQGVNTDIFNVNNTKIELLESISKDSPINKYISKHGQGMHHLVLIVEDIVTTGGSINELITLTETYNANIIGIVSIVDKNDKLKIFKYPYETLLNFPAQSWEEQDCPEWLMKVPIREPGRTGKND